VGPIVFPFGVLGEMAMVLTAAQLSTHNTVYLYFAASLWPLGFYPLMKQLWKQRQRHFKQIMTRGTPFTTVPSTAAAAAAHANSNHNKKPLIKQV